MSKTLKNIGDTDLSFIDHNGVTKTICAGNVFSCDDQSADNFLKYSKKQSSAYGIPCGNIEFTETNEEINFDLSESRFE